MMTTAKCYWCSATEDLAPYRYADGSTSHPLCPKCRHDARQDDLDPLYNGRANDTASDASERAHEYRQAGRSDQ